MTFGVVTFPGSNCDQDIINVLRDNFDQKVNELWHKSEDLLNSDIIILPGGFSYGDYLRAGALATYSPIMKSIVQFAKRGGMVIGICNGFQILCETGLLPGTLLKNLNLKFICKNVYLKLENENTVITNRVNKKVLKIPIAHSEGRFYINNIGLDKLQKNQQIIFKYCNSEGKVNDESNPNGALQNIAAISNKNKNVFGIMPHPERAADQILNSTDGATIFKSILSHKLPK